MGEVYRARDTTLNARRRDQGAAPGVRERSERLAVPRAERRLSPRSIEPRHRAHHGLEASGGMRTLRNGTRREDLAAPVAPSARSMAMRCHRATSHRGAGGRTRAGMNRRLEDHEHRGPDRSDREGPRPAQPEGMKDPGTTRHCLEVDNHHPPSTQQGDSRDRGLHQSPSRRRRAATTQASISAFGVDACPRRQVRGRSLGS